MKKNVLCFAITFAMLATFIGCTDDSFEDTTPNSLDLILEKDGKKYESSKVEYKCDKCEQGFVEFTKINEDKKYIHNCNLCDDEVEFENDFFPRIMYVEILD